MTNEKKCTGCKLMTMCAAYHAVSKIAGILNCVMNDSIDEKTPFTSIIDTVAHDCKYFQSVKE